MLGIAGAAHAEYGPPAGAPLLITPVACAVPDRAPGAPSLSGRLRVRLRPASRVAQILRSTEIEEEYFCSYELNPKFQSQLEAAGLRVTGVDAEGAARVVELPHHRFFLATAFLPQLSSTPARPHPLVMAFLRAAAGADRFT